jgi:cell division protein FtsZ
MRERGAVVTAIVTRPFAVERRRKLRADMGIIELGKAAQTVLILEFEKMRSVLPAAMVLPQLFSVMNHIIALSIRNLWECTYSASFVNFECDDLHYMLEHGKIGTLLLGEFPLNEKKNCRTLSEIQVPIMDFPIHEVKGCIIHITAGNDICLFETDQLAMMVSEPFDLHTEVIYGTTIRNEMEGKVRLVSIITGLWECGRDPEKPGTFPVGPESKDE